MASRGRVFTALPAASSPAEAGATVTDVFGSRWHPDCDSILASADPAFAAAVLGVSRAMSR